MLVAAMAVGACQSDEFVSDTDVVLQFSGSRLDFDTLFAPLGSATAYFTVHNTSSQNIVIQQVRLSKGENSPFRINVNGQANEALSVRLAKKDSLFVFVEVRKNEMLLLSDSVQFNVGGHWQYFPLRAYSRDAVVVNDTVYAQNVNFSNEKPYLFLNNVVIKNNAAVTVQEGAQLLFDWNKGVRIEGLLQVNGSAARPVLFANLRYREAWYAQPGQWQGFTFAGGSKNNRIAWAQIQGTTVGILIKNSSPSADTQLTLSHSALLYTQHHLCVTGGRVVVDSSLFLDNKNEIKLIYETIFVPHADSTMCL
ncbi:hypothetical protein FACS1894156_1230 [Bacteroidia bacterium]|nr:hypothetical protein FACS1894156_1230 [Bacteroidia bacterium]